MDRIDARTQARELLDQVYMTAPPGDPGEGGAAELVALARRAAADGVPLGEHAGAGPWRSDRCRFPHGGAPQGEDVTCVVCGEFELPLPRDAAADVAALLNWAEVPEPGAQT